jgi:putative FmdB family regulatory protein
MGVVSVGNSPLTHFLHIEKYFFELHRIRSISMPIFEYLCLDCGKISEILVVGSDDSLRCNSCNSLHLKKLISAHSSMSGPHKNNLPGLGDTACCGSSPVEAGCAGPGSCCGKKLNTE